MVEVKLSPLELDPLGALRRDPPRPPEHRQPGYEEQFDYLTVFYDCFASADGEWIVLLGPPLANLEPIIRALLVQACQSFDSKRWQVRRRRLDRVDEIFLTNVASRLTLSDQRLRQRRLIVQPNLCRLFRGKRVLLSKNRDNELIWIRDWAYFYAAKHGCNAVLIYDNGSTKYDSTRVRKTLSTVPGLDVVVVVDWPFKFGPQVGPAGIWDSDFCQYGILEHARHRFLALADAVMSVDIDELVLTPDGSTIYECVHRSQSGYLHFAGHWIENATLADREPRRHADFVYRSAAEPQRAKAKWAVLPARCGTGTQWLVHNVAGLQNDLPLALSIALRHFRAISTGWNYARWRPERPGEHHVVDRELVEWLRIFEQDRS